MEIINQYKSFFNNQSNTLQKIQQQWNILKKNLNGGQDNNIRNVYNDKMSKYKARKKINQSVIHLDE
ncbi:MAG: hypothetical protein KDD45_06775, partial [Bdellovibrionales bacterium]|nr:hypothetical protein [Bdellovibrionales bacterium]